jgi:hypothetical protein
VAISALGQKATNPPTAKPHRCPLWSESGQIRQRPVCPLSATSGHRGLFNHLVGPGVRGRQRDKRTFAVLIFRPIDIWSASAPASRRALRLAGCGRRVRPRLRRYLMLARNTSARSATQFGRCGYREALVKTTNSFSWRLRFSFQSPGR